MSNFIRRIIEKKYDMAQNNAKELLTNTPDRFAGKETLDFASELNTGKLGKLMRHLDINLNNKVII